MHGVVTSSALTHTQGGQSEADDGDDDEQTDNKDRDHDCH